MNEAAQVVGLVGAACIVLAYWRITTGYWCMTSSRYYLTNLAGALLLVCSLLINFNLGSMVIEGFWVSISIHGLLKNRKKYVTKV